MDNISFLTEVLTTDHEYWVVAKKCMASNYGRYERIKDQVIFIAIPSKIERDIDRDCIKLTDLEKIQSEEITGNIFLSDDYTPFQHCQNFHSIYIGFPIPDKEVNNFLRKAILFKSDDIFQYKKIIDELNNY